MDNTKTNNPRRNKKGKYDVALSFAEEDRTFVSEVAQYLRFRKVRFFYDDDKRIDSWGRNLYDYLDKVYREEATFCVIFISNYYKKKRWTNHERIRAQARAFYENEAYILPFKFDNTEIEEIPDTTAYLSREGYNAEQLAQAIIDKLEISKTSWSRIKRRVSKMVTPRARKLFLALATGGVLTYTLADKFTPVDVLTRRLYERSMQVSEGAICIDGTISSSTGRGTCSHHGGVDYQFKDTIYSKTLEQCRKEAEDISLLPSTSDTSSR